MGARTQHASSSRGGHDKEVDPLEKQRRILTTAGATARAAVFGCACDFVVGGSVPTKSIEVSIYFVQG